MTGIARDLIRTGLAGGGNKSLADRLMRIERRIVALEQQSRDTNPTWPIGSNRLSGANERMQSVDRTMRDLLAMFDALLKTLTNDSTRRAR